MIMMVFIGGIVAAFFGIIGILIWFKPFLQLMAGAIPMMLLLGGALAAYLGYDEVKDKLPFFKKKEETDEFTAGPKDDLSKYREEAERYKQEAERLQAELEKAKSEG
jgi:sugar (pentulose or hexulose) kinase